MSKYFDRFLCVVLMVGVSVLGSHQCFDTGRASSSKPVPLVSKRFCSGPGHHHRHVACPVLDVAVPTSVPMLSAARSD